MFLTTVEFLPEHHKHREQCHGLGSTPNLRAEIDRLRRRQRPSLGPVIPERQRASDPSLRARLIAAHEHISELQAENRRLRAALAEALGANRAAATRHTPVDDTDHNRELQVRAMSERHA